MNESKLWYYYTKIHKESKYIIEGWSVIDERFYLKIKNKLKIINIMGCYKGTDATQYPNSRTFVVESKDKYIAFLITNCFICYKESNTEYGLVGEYNLLAVNKENLTSTTPNIPYSSRLLVKTASTLSTITESESHQDIKPFTLIDLCRIFDIKMTNKAKEILSILEGF